MAVNLTLAGLSLLARLAVWIYGVPRLFYVNGRVSALKERPGYATLDFQAANESLIGIGSYTELTIGSIRFGWGQTKAS